MGVQIGGGKILVHRDLKALHVTKHLENTLKIIYKLNMSFQNSLCTYMVLNFNEKRTLISNNNNYFIGHVLCSQSFFRLFIMLDLQNITKCETYFRDGYESGRGTSQNRGEPGKRPMSRCFLYAN